MKSVIAPGWSASELRYTFEDDVRLASQGMDFVRIVQGAEDRGDAEWL